jgi:hypothetical protein
MFISIIHEILNAQQSAQMAIISVISLWIAFAGLRSNKGSIISVISLCVAFVAIIKI